VCGGPDLVSSVVADRVVACARLCLLWCDCVQSWCRMRDLDVSAACPIKRPALHRAHELQLPGGCIG